MSKIHKTVVKTLIVSSMIAFAIGGKAMKLTSSAFQNMDPIPPLHTCDGSNVSPPLSWEGAPSNTKSFLLIAKDPDAPNGIWYHWIVFNLPANTKGLPKEIRDFPKGTRFGKNSWGEFNYGGPCPPKGDKGHRYVFKLLALDKMLDSKTGATEDQILQEAKGHIVGETEIIGMYERPED